jgi:hypothetical protein
MRFDNDVSNSRPVRDAYPRPRDIAQDLRMGIVTEPAKTTSNASRPGGTVERLPRTRDLPSDER